MAEKRVSSATSRAAAAGGRVAGPVPVGIHPLLRRFWDFTKDTARKFAKHLPDPEKREDEFLKVVRRDFEKWT